jgi:hypothetical protein
MIHKVLLTENSASDIIDFIKAWQGVPFAPPSSVIVTLGPEL